MKNKNNINETHRQKEQKPRKITLYFKEETMLELTRLKDMLILTCLPSNKLPGMNEIVDGIIVYSKYILNKYPGDRERLRNYAKGKTSETTREYEPFKITDESTEIEENREEFKKLETRKLEKKNTRFLYNLTAEEQSTLNEIRTTTGIEQTDATLIRTITEFTIMEKIDKITLIRHIFIGVLFELSPKTSIKILSEDRPNIETIKKLGKEEKEKIRKITWDHGAFNTLKKAIETERKHIFNFKSGKRTGGKLYWIFGLQPKTYNSIIEKTTSRVNNFNYTLTYSGMTAITGMIAEKIDTIPEAIIQINQIKNYEEPYFIEEIEQLMKISDTINNTPEL